MPRIRTASEASASPGGSDADCELGAQELTAIDALDTAGGTTAIVLTTMQLGAVAAGNEVTNPFVVTEVYVQEHDAWTLGSMSFTRLVTPLEETTA